MSDRFIALEHDRSSLVRPVWGVWDSERDEWGRITFGGDFAHDMAIGCAAQWNHMLDRRLEAEERAAANPKDYEADGTSKFQGGTIPHRYPPGEEYCHTASIHCLCHPQIETSIISGAVWYEHKPLVIVEEANTFPEHWTTQAG